MLLTRHVGDVAYAVESSDGCSISLDDALYRDLGKADEVDVDDLIDCLFERAGEPRPLSLTWSMTKRCNFSCPFCYIRDNSLTSDPVFEDVRPMIDRMVSLGLVRATLTGGECLLVRDFRRIYRHLKERGVLVSLFTNGSLVNKETLDLFRELPPFSVEITFYDCNFEGPSYRAALLLRDMGVDVLGKFTVSRENVVMLDVVEQWCASNELPFLFDPMLFNGDNGIDAKSHSVSDDLLADLNVRRFGLGFKDDSHPCSPIRAMQCKAADRSVFLSPELELSVCPDMSYRWSTRNLGFDEAYRRMRSWIDGLRDVPLEGCKGCVNRSLCTMCAARSVLADSPSGTRISVPEGYCEEISRLGKKMRERIHKLNGHTNESEL